MDSAATPARPPRPADDSVWTRRFLPRHGDGVGFDRVVFFSDAVFAIALTLAAVEIGIPELSPDEAGDPTRLWTALLDKSPLLIAYVVAFVWVALYWRANHRFVMTLRGMDSRYVLATMGFLALTAVLPIPAAILGEYFENPTAVAVFAVYATAVSTMEVVLFVAADRGGLFVAPLSPAFRREQLLGSLSPVLVFLPSIALAFWWSSTVAVLWWLVGSVATGWLLARFLQAPPPPDPPESDDRGPA